MTNDQIEVIERLRAAAKEHGEVADLLDVLDEALFIDELGNKAIVGNDVQVGYLQAAIVAAKFARYDRRQDGGK